jgi:hypothetical protein
MARQLERRCWRRLRRHGAIAIMHMSRCLVFSIVDDSCFSIVVTVVFALLQVRRCKRGLGRAIA